MGSKGGNPLLIFAPLIVAFVFFPLGCVNIRNGCQNEYECTIGDVELIKLERVEKKVDEYVFTYTYNNVSYCTESFNLRSNNESFDDLFEQKNNKTLPAKVIGNVCDTDMIYLIHTFKLGFWYALVFGIIIVIYLLYFIYYCFKIK
jgi:hypothetical protein